MTSNQGDTSTQDSIRTYSKDENLVRERRKHIAYCAHKVFFEKGFKGTTMRQLAKACGMAPSALYRYIGSKSDILHLICINMSEAENNLEVILDGLGNVSTTEELRQCIKFYFQGADETQDLIIFFNREIRNFSREDRWLLLDAQLRIMYFFQRLITKGIKAGEFKVRSPVLVAHNILMLGHDWAMRRWFLRQHFTLEEYTEEHTEFILDAIGVRVGEASASGDSKDTEPLR